MSRRRIAQVTVIACGALALVAVAHAAAPKRGKTPLPRPRPIIHQVFQVLSPAPLSILPATFTAQPAPSAALAYARPDTPLATAPTASTPASDVETVKRVANLVDRHRISEASALKSSIRDPLAGKLVEWIILRGDENHTPGFERYAAFVSANPGWPSVGLLRKRAEAALWDDKRDTATVLSYFHDNPPRSAKGRFALARALLARGLARGDTRNAERHVRDAWQTDGFSPAIERIVLETFPGMLRPVDHRIRMHRRFYAEDNAAGHRAALHLGAADQAIAKAWAAVNHRSKNAKALLDAVPAGARHNPGYVFCLVRWLRRNDKPSEAAKALAKGPHDLAEILVPDEWWVERRLIARALIEAGEHQAAYRVARDAVVPVKGNYRVDREFHAGWIALRFLKDPATAARHFAAIAADTHNPTALARAGYWQGRTAEARGHTGEARGFYGKAARYATTYYGQLARARLGETDITIASPPAPSRERKAAVARLEVVRALELVYAAGERDLAIPIVADLAHRTGDPDVLAAMAEITHRHKDARATMLIGRGALNQGLRFAQYAFPLIGVPRYTPIGPELDPSILYSIIRQESAFNQNTVSSANAMGLMQVTPAAGRYIARKFKVSYDKKRLLSDTTYNVQMGSAELGDLIRDYRGSYILAFVGYNAGRGRVRDWIARYGDPRDPNVDPVDWVEMIPFAETRNYVQRIMENMQVYRARLGASRRPTIEADLHRDTAKN